MEVSEARGNFETLNERLNNSDNKKADKTEVSNLESQIKSLASGSPFVATSIDEMTDKSKVYVNTTDGHWYTHNGTTWVDGGVYQSTEIADNSITSNKIKKIVDLAQNIEFIFGKTIDQSTGELIDSDYASVSELIPVRDSNEDLIYENLYFSKVPKNGIYSAFYNKNQEFLNTVQIFEDEQNFKLTFLNKPNTYYIRIIKYPNLNNDLIVSDQPFENLKWLKIENENLSDDLKKSINKIKKGVDLVEKTNFTLNSNVDYQGNIIDSKIADLSDLIKIRNDDGTRIYDNLFFSKVPANGASCIVYGKDQKWIGNLASDEEKENWIVTLDDKARGYYIRIVRYHDYMELKVTDEEISELKWLKIIKGNLPKDILFNNYLSRPDNGELHFTVNIERKINNVVDTYTDNCVLFLPPNYKNTGKKTRMVISCHGSGTIINDEFHINSKTWNKFLYDMGYAILDVNGGVEDGRHYGAPFAIQSYIKAYQYAIENYNLYKEVFVLGASMGGLSSFSLVENSQIPVLAQADFCCVVDHYKSAWCRPWWDGNLNDYSLQRKAIAQYFNFNNYDTFQDWTTSQIPSDEEKQYYLENIDKITGYNPIIKNAINIDNIYTSEKESTEYAKMSKIHKVPLKIWHSKADTTVLYQYSQYLYNAIKKAGGLVELKLYETGVHTPGWGEKEKITNYNNETIEGFNNEVECYEWFKRFE